MRPTLHPDAFPLLLGRGPPASERHAALVRAPPGALAAEYLRLSCCAPQRGRPFFSSRRDGATRRASSGRREKRLAMALFNAGSLWSLEGGGGFHLLDYQTPLMPRRADAKVGKVDLLGLDVAGRLTVVELKIEGEGGTLGSTPLLALAQALRHAAILERSRATLAVEMRERFGRQVAADAPVLLLLGTRTWWERHLSAPAASSWRPAFLRLLDECEAAAGVKVCCGAISGSDLWSGLQAERPTFLSLPRIDLLGREGLAL